MSDRAPAAAAAVAATPADGAHGGGGAGVAGVAGVALGGGNGAAPLVRLVPLIVAGWATLGLLRVALRFAFGGVSRDAVASAVATPLLDAAIWAAVTVAAVAVVRRWPWEARRAGRTVAAHAVVAAAMTVVEAAALRALLVAMEGWTPPPFRVTFLNRVDLNVFAYLGAVAVAYALDHRARARGGAAAAAVLQSRLAGAQLHVLTMQLQPHFLFNTLHTISELVHADAAAARRTLGNLAALFRMSLDGAAAQEVTLDEELRFLAAYVDIQLTRFGDRLTITASVDDETRRAVVPHLVLQPLVENAIRHGTSRRAAPGHVLVSARRVRGNDGDGDVLEILVRDDGPGLGARPPVYDAGGAPPAPRSSSSAPAVGAAASHPNGGSGNGSGLGVGNTRARLRQLYGAAHAFELADAPGGGVLARVRVPWRTTPRHVIAPAGATTMAADAAPPPLAPTDADDEPGEAKEGGAGRPWGAGRWAALVLAAWTAYGLLSSQELHAMYVVEKQTPPAWGKLVAIGLTDAWGWALWTALVVWIARRAPLGRRNWRWLVPLHLALAHVVAFAHLWFLRAVGAVGSSYPLVDSHNLTILYWDVFAYIVVLAFTHAVVYRSRWRTRERESARLAAAVAAAELELLRWRLQPRFLLDTLAAISRLVDHEVDRADRMVARLGDLLRSLLPNAHEQRTTLRDELGRLDAYLDIVALRDGRTVTVQLDADADVLDLPAPAMVLQPMAERALGLDADSGGRASGDARAVAAAQPACLWVFALRERGRLVLALRGDGAAGTSQRVELPIPATPRPAAATAASPVAAARGQRGRTHRAMAGGGSGGSGGVA